MREPSGCDLFLIGMRAVGKTTLGQRLAEYFSRPFVDTDREIEKCCGTSVNEVLRRHGEAEFRRIECDVVQDLGPGSGRVIATGGGVPLAESNRRHLRTEGYVVYLFASVQVLIERRIQDELQKPVMARRILLSGATSEEETATTLAFRDPLYRLCADFVVDVSSPMDLSLQKTVDVVRSGAPKFSGS